MQHSFNDYSCATFQMRFETRFAAKKFCPTDRQCPHCTITKQFCIKTFLASVPASSECKKAFKLRLLYDFLFMIINFSQTAGTAKNGITFDQKFSKWCCMRTLRRNTFRLWMRLPMSFYYSEYYAYSRERNYCYLSRVRIYSMERSLDENRELPGHFLHELYKWALECESLWLLFVTQESSSLIFF